jgi:hypothetical protein
MPFIFAVALIISSVYFLYSLFKVFDLIGDKVEYIIDNANKIFMKKSVKKDQDHSSLFTSIFVEIFNLIINHLLKQKPLKMFIYSTIAILVILLISFPNLFHQPQEGLIALAAFFIVFKTITDFICHIAKHEFIGNFYFDFAYVISHALLMSLYLFASLAKDIDNGDVNFISIVILLVIVLYPLCKYAKTLFDEKTKKINFIIILSLLIVFELTIFLFFGAYNISSNRDYYNLITFDDYTLTMLKIIQIGTTNVFNYPGVTTDISYTIQYLIGFLLHVIILGYFISYVPSKIMQQEEKRPFLHYVRVKRHTSIDQ